MKTSPVELRQVEFKKVMRGVDPEQAKAYFENAADDIEMLLLENKTLKEELDKYKTIETKIKEASRVAEENANAIVDKAKQESEAFIQDTLSKNEEMEKQLNSLRIERNNFILQFKTILASYMSMLDKEFPIIQYEDKSESHNGSQQAGSNSNV